MLSRGSQDHSGIQQATFEECREGERGLPGEHRWGATASSCFEEESTGWGQLPQHGIESGEDTPLAVDSDVDPATGYCQERGRRRGSVVGGGERERRGQRSCLSHRKTVRRGEACQWECQNNCSIEEDDTVQCQGVYV